MMTKNSAQWFIASSIPRIARDLACYTDLELKEELKKLDEKIDVHRSAINKLELKKEKLIKEATENHLILAERKKKEAIQYMATYDAAVSEVENRLNRRP